MPNPNGRTPGCISWNGQRYTIPQLAKQLNVAPRTFYYRVKQHGLDKAIAISQMNETEYQNYRGSVNCEELEKSRKVTQGKYEYKGEKYTYLALAKLFNLHYKMFHAWVSRYGYDRAIMLAEMPEQKRKAEMTRINEEMKEVNEVKTDDTPIPKLDPDYELKNRIKHWIRRYGMEGAIAKASLRI